MIFEIKKNKKLIFAKKYTMRDFSSELILWYKAHKRSLPWRKTKDPYHIWISEIILQQTRVIQGISYYDKFTNTFPTVGDLALATEDQVLKLWEGLGYYSRARNMHAAAKKIYFELDGVFPSTYNDLIELKGVGPYTAAAISSICYNEHKTVVDGNVFRVLSRLFGIDTAINSTIGKKQFEKLAHSLNTGSEHGLFNQALMEFGALHCTPKLAKCETCIFQDTCEALRSDKVDVLPVKEKKLKVRNRYLSFLCIIDANDNTLIQRREGKGIWEGLYQFPLYESDEEVSIENFLNSDFVKELVLVAKKEIVYTNQVKHKLTHQTLYINKVILKIDQLLKTNIFDIESISNLKEYAFPKPLTDIVARFSKE